MTRKDRDKLAAAVRARMERAYETGRDGRDKLRADVRGLLDALVSAEAEADALYLSLCRAATPADPPGAAQLLAQWLNYTPALMPTALATGHGVNVGRLIDATAKLLNRESGGPIPAPADPASTGQGGPVEAGPPALDKPGGEFNAGAPPSRSIDEAQGATVLFRPIADKPGAVVIGSGVKCEVRSGGRLCVLNEGHAVPHVFPRARRSR